MGRLHLILMMIQIRIRILDLDLSPSVCGQDFSETRGWIFMKISSGVDLGQGTTPFNFHDDPDPDSDSGSGSELLDGSF